MNVKTNLWKFSSIGLSVCLALYFRWLDTKASAVEFSQVPEHPAFPPGRGEPGGIGEGAGTFVPIYEHPAFPPGHGQPGGIGQGAGTFGDEDACLSQHSNLVALVPELTRGEAWGLTTLSHPSFFAVIPDLPDDVEVAEFVLEDTKARGEGSDVYRTQFNLPDEAGIIRIDLPEEEEYQLEIDRKYRWVLTILCSLDEEEPSAIFVSANVIRTEVGDYAENQLWYDRLQELAEQANSTNFQESWEELLSAVGLEDVADADFLPCCTPNAELTPTP